MAFSIEQQQIIDAPKGPILVSAAAGSGKTTVMTARLAKRIKDGVLSADRMLVLTFTKNAAAHMKQKLQENLIAEIKGLDGDEREKLQKQLDLLQQAQISTIHAFCYRIIQEHGHLLNHLKDEKAPRFTRLPELMDEALDARQFSKTFKRCLKDAFATVHPEMDWTTKEAVDPEAVDFADFLQRYFNGDVSALEKTTKTFYDHLRSQADYLNGLDQILSKMACWANKIEDAPFIQSLWADFVLLIRCLKGTDKPQAEVDLPQDLADLSAPLAQIKRLARTDGAMLLKGKGKDERQAALFDWLDRLDAVVQIVETDGQSIQEKWQKISDLAKQAPPFPPWRNQQNDHPSKALLTECLCTWVIPVVRALMGGFGTDKFKSYHLFWHLGGIFQIDLAEERKHFSAALADLSCFLDFVKVLDFKDCHRRYVNNQVNFQDLEQLAYELIQMPEVETYYRQRYTEIYVDEFQDTSVIQKAIIDHIQQDNLFVVGDAKQSIYQFRHARPQLFQTLEAAYQKDDHPGQNFYLNRNYRSCGNILNLANHVFEQVMLGSQLEIDYHANHRFVIPESEENTSESNPDSMAQGGFLVYVDQPSSDGDAEGLPEAANLVDQRPVLPEELAVQLIRQLVRPKANYPSFQFRDICILVPTNQTVQSYLGVLTEAGIPCQSGAPKFTNLTYEQELVIQFIYLMTNVFNDYALAAVLLSPISWARYREDDLLVLAGLRTYLRDLMHQEIDDTPLKEVCKSYRLYSKSFAEAFFEWTRLMKTEPTRCAEVIHFCVISQAELIKHRTAEDVTQLIQQMAETSRHLFEIRERIFYDSAADCLRSCFLDEDWMVYFQTLENGKNRLAKLEEILLFVDRLCRTEGLNWVDIQAAMEQAVKARIFTQEKGADLSLRPNVVSVLTDHASKGLEFPVVLMGDIAFKTQGHSGALYEFVDYKFESRKDASQVDEAPAPDQYIALNYWRWIEGVRVFEPLIMHQVGLQTKRYAAFAEKLRLIYVGMTRAEKQLYFLLPEWKTIRHKIFEKRSRYSIVGDADDLKKRLQIQHILELKSLGEVLAYVDICADQCLPLQKIGVCLEDIKAVSASSQLTTAQGLSTDAMGTFSKAELEALLRRALARTEEKLPLMAQMPSKFTVSEIKRMADWHGDTVDEVSNSLYEHFIPGLRALPYNMQSVHTILDEVQHSQTRQFGAQLGITLHKLHQLLPWGTLYQDLQAESDDRAQDVISKFLEDYYHAGLLTHEAWVSAVAFVPNLVAFLRHDLCRQMNCAEQYRQQGGFGVRQEMPFTLALEPSELGMPIFAFDRHLLVQGMIDLWFDTGEDLVLLDYKSDWLSGDDETVQKVLRERYGKQLDIYQIAVERAVGRPLTARWIWSIRRQKAYSI